MIKVEIDEKRLKDISHFEIRERKEGIVLIEVPKVKKIKCVSPSVEK